jgi:hypothetical protein
MSKRAEEKALSPWPEAKTAALAAQSVDLK